MVLQKLKRVFSSRKVSAESLGQDLVDLILDYNSEDELLGIIKDNSIIISKQELDLLLTCSYLFSYKLVVKINDIQISSNFLDEIYYNFLDFLHKDKLKQYNLDRVKNSKLERKVNKLIHLYEKRYPTKKTVKIKEVIDLLCAEIDREFNEDFKKELSNFLLKNITLIQDFLVKTSLCLDL